MCKYKQDIANSKETGAAVCTRKASNFPINYGDNCYFLLRKRELQCGDCARFGEDFACIESEVNSNAYITGKMEYFMAQ